MNNFLVLVKDTAMQIASVAVISIFVQNIIFTRALGTSASLFIIRKRYSVWQFGLILTVITTLSSILTYFADKRIQRLRHAYYMMPLFYVMIVGVVYVATLLFCSRFLRKYNEQIQPMIHLSAFNGAVFGALFLSSKYNLIGHIAFGLGVGIGFILASYLISLGYDRLNSDKISPSFRGFPITLIYVGILSLAFYGLIGHELSI